MTGDERTKEREHRGVQQAVAAYKYLLAHGRVTAHEMAKELGLHVSNSYRLLDNIAEVAGLYKEGIFYVLLPEL